MNFDPIQKIDPKVRDGCSFVGGPSLMRLWYMHKRQCDPWAYSIILQGAVTLIHWINSLWCQWTPSCHLFHPQCTSHSDSSTSSSLHWQYQDPLRGRWVGGRGWSKSVDVSLVTYKQWKWEKPGIAYYVKDIRLMQGSKGPILIRHELELESKLATSQDEHF